MLQKKRKKKEKEEENVRKRKKKRKGRTIRKWIGFLDINSPNHGYFGISRPSLHISIYIPQIIELN